ncbi:MAG: TIGR00300 family protein, partial [Actinobacteria bacterium]|nr:TIGR00300 family protein [Actinomycetota bacterium]
MPSEDVTLEGHIIDSLTLPTVLDEIVELGGTFEIAELRVGTRHEDTSFARISVSTDDDDALAALVERLQQLGANPSTVEDAQLATADIAGSFPPGFYSTTNLETEVRVSGRWIRVVHPEMDCGIVVTGDDARTIPMAEVTSGMQIVMGGLGIRVTAPEKPRADDRQAFEFMSSNVSSEKPKSLLVEQVADQMRAVKERGERIMWVAGPAVVHTGSAPDVCALIRAGFVDALFAGNGVAAHDIESNMFGTSLG